jgi:hypothetical protein
MKNDLIKQNKHLLWLLMEFGIHRYLLSNTYGRLDGYEKAERNIHLCNIFIASKKYCDIECARFENEDLFNLIHDKTQALTSYLDTEIKFPVDKDSSEIDYSKRFFHKFIKLAEQAYQEYNKK